MRGRFALSTAAALVGAAAVLAASVAPTEARPPATRMTTVPHAVMAHIGYVYAGGLENNAGGIITYAQGADGSLTQVGFTQDSGPAHALALIHLSKGLALYDLAGLSSSYLYGYSINPATGALTKMASTPRGPYLTGAGGMAAYDPLKYNVVGGIPLLFFGACQTTMNNACNAVFGSVALDPATGALGTVKIGVVPYGQNVSRLEPVVGDGAGRFVDMEFSVTNSTAQLASYGVRGTGKNQKLIFLYGTPVADTGPGGKGMSLGVDSPIFLTSNHQVVFGVSGLPDLQNDPSGMVSFLFASNGRVEYPYDGTFTAFGQDKNRVIGSVVAGSTQDPSICAMAFFGLANLGVQTASASVPCYGYGQIIDPEIVMSMLSQGPYVYLGRYGAQSVALHDTGVGAVTATKQSAIPMGGQVYSWAGYLTPKPTVTMPAKVSLAAGIPLTITCAVVCSGTTAALFHIGGGKGVFSTGNLVIRSHSAGTFVFRIVPSLRSRTLLAAALRAKKQVKVSTTTNVSAGGVSTLVVLTATVGP